MDFRPYIAWDLKYEKWEKEYISSITSEVAIQELLEKYEQAKKQFPDGAWFVLFSRLSEEALWKRMEIWKWKQEIRKDTTKKHISERVQISKAKLANEISYPSSHLNEPITYGNEWHISLKDISLPLEAHVPEMISQKTPPPHTEVPGFFQWYKDGVKKVFSIFTK